jgi:hypothetical protein
MAMDVITKLLARQLTYAIKSEENSELVRSAIISDVTRLLDRMHSYPLTPESQPTEDLAAELIDLPTEVIEWLAENLLSPTVAVEYDTDRYELIFDSEHDAMLFELRWK